MTQMLTLEVGSGLNPDLTYILHNDIVKRPGIDTPGNILELDFEPGSISLIFMNQIFEHLSYFEQSIFLGKASDWLCGGGGIIISTPDSEYIDGLEDSDWKEKLSNGIGDNKWDRHVGLVDKQYLRESLEFDGFEIVGMETVKGSIICNAVKGRIW